MFISSSDFESLTLLAENLGYDDVYSCIESYALESVQPGICIDCGYVNYSLEPDSDSGYCEDCQAPKCRSISILAGLI